MKADRSIEDNLKTALKKLQQDITDARKRETDQNEIDLRCNSFDMNWLDRLNDFEQGELRGCKRGIEAAVENVEQQKQNERDMSDNALLRSMDKEDQVAFWASNRNGGDGQLWENERQQVVAQSYEQSSQDVQDRYVGLREGMQQAVDNIRDGKNPSLNFLLEQQIDDAETRVRKAYDLVGRQSVNSGKDKDRFPEH